jgi:DNA polymerase-1
VPRAKANEFIAAYDTAFPDVLRMLSTASSTARDRGYVKTLLGRRSRFPDRQNLHKALNSVIQGSAADLMKMKLVELYRERRALGLTLRMTVHDEVCGDVPDLEAARMVGELLNRQSIPLRVPILWEGNTGANWKECA